MTWRKIVARAAVLALFLQAAVADAAPSVFIPASPGSAWWTTDTAQGRVIGTSAGGVTVTLLTKFVEATEPFDNYKICALSPVVSDTYVGLDKAVQDDITKMMPSLHFRLQAGLPGGRQIVAQSVLFEDCDDKDNRGAAVLVTDPQTSQVLLFERMGTFTRNGSPIWTAFLERPAPGSEDAPLFSFSHCTECGASTAVYYDISRRKLYTEYNGH